MVGEKKGKRGASRVEEGKHLTQKWINKGKTFFAVHLKARKLS
jgi:hypothetical protein